MAAIIRRNPSRALAVVQPLRPYSVVDEVEMMLRDFWPVGYYRTHTSDFLPIDMWEEKDELVMRTEVPGIKREDIDVSLEGNLLTVKAERKQEKLTEDRTSYVCERSYGRYSRSVSLPFPVDADKITTTFDNGVLEVRLPKAEEAKAKHIHIKGGTQKALPKPKFP